MNPWACVSLAAAGAEIVPVLAIASFNGLRQAEVSRLDCRDCVPKPFRQPRFDHADLKEARRREAHTGSLGSEEPPKCLTVVTDSSASPTSLPGLSRTDC